MAFSPISRWPSGPHERAGAVERTRQPQHPANERNPELAGDRPGQEFGLVEAAPPSPPERRRNRDDRGRERTRQTGVVVPGRSAKGRNGGPRQEIGEDLPPPELELQQGALEHALVGGGSHRHPEGPPARPAFATAARRRGGREEQATLGTRGNGKRAEAGRALGARRAGQRIGERPVAEAAALRKDKLSEGAPPPHRKRRLGGHASRRGAPGRAEPYRIR